MALWITNHWTWKDWVSKIDRVTNYDSEYEIVLYNQRVPFKCFKIASDIMLTKNENFPIRPNAKWNFYLKSLSYDVHFNENSWKNSESTRPRLFLFIWKSSISTDCLVPRIIQFYFSMSLFDDWTQIRCSNSRKCSRKSLTLKLRILAGKPERNQE